MMQVILVCDDYFLLCIFSSLSHYQRRCILFILILSHTCSSNVTHKLELLCIRCILFTCNLIDYHNGALFTLTYLCTPPLHSTVQILKKCSFLTNNMFCLLCFDNSTKSHYQWNLSFILLCFIYWFSFNISILSLL